MCVAQKQAALKPPPAPTPPGACELTPVYFDYDSSTLSDSARDQLSRNASCLRERGTRGAQLTGMTDPRGTEEYNLALGERRAQAAQQYLKSLGTDANLSVSSMGEEMASGSDEAGWARDRRVDFKGK
jgi:peptidoglycan-associated lipoprotein